jgi:hypothetical protein
MALTMFEASVKYLGLVSVPVGGGAAVGGSALPFQMQHQLQTQWCWAAVTASTAAYYRSGPWTQCSVVNALLAQTACCVSGNSAFCNQPFYLDRALTRTGNFSALAPGKLSLVDLNAEIEAGRPIGVRVGWGGGGGHFLAVTGASRTGTLQVADPWFGTSTTDYLTFSTRYQGFGTWTHTYRTKGQGALHGNPTAGTSTRCIPAGRAGA